MRMSRFRLSCELGGVTAPARLGANVLGVQSRRGQKDK